LNQGECGAETGVCIEILRYSHKMLFENPNDKGSPGEYGGGGLKIFERVGKTRGGSERVFLEWEGAKF